MVEKVPYDPNLYFEGEETTMALRLFTNGFDIFHIPRIPLFHCYTDYTNEAKRPMHWNEEENKERLFLFKLATFEWDKIKDADKTFKKNIRKAKDIHEVLSVISNHLKK